MERRQFLALMAAAGSLPAFSAFAQQAVTHMLVGATPGGGTDLIARELAMAMSKLVSRQFVVDNRPGAAGNIAAHATAQAAPNGNTLLVSYTSHAINPSMGPALSFDPINDFTPLCGIASSPAVLVARPSFEANNLGEMIELAKSHPGKISIAIAGLGSANHLAGAKLEKDAGIQLLSVPYKGTGPALADVAAGHTDVVFGGVASVRGLLEGGKLKPLAVSSAERLPDYKDVPTASEFVPGFVYSSWYGLFGPANMPTELAEEFSRVALDAIRSDNMSQRLNSEGMVPLALPQKEFEEFVRNEIKRWAQVIAETGLAQKT